jgi:hypothetical protein
MFRTTSNTVERIKEGPLKKLKTNVVVISEPGLQLSPPLIPHIPNFPRLFGLESRRQLGPLSAFIPFLLSLSERTLAFPLFLSFRQKGNFDCGQIIFCHVSPLFTNIFWASTSRYSCISKSSF